MKFDAKGLKCPLPVLKARRYLSQLQSGECLTIDTTDPDAPQDFTAFIKETGHKLIKMDVKDDKNAQIIIEKS